MAALHNQRYEAFARARVRGLTRIAAYTIAGFVPSRGGGSRLGGRSEIKRRIAELTVEAEKLRGASLEATIIALLQSAGDPEKPDSAAQVRESRLNRLEALRLAGLLAVRDDVDDDPLPPELTEAEWEAKYGPNAPGYS